MWFLNTVTICVLMDVYLESNLYDARVSKVSKPEYNIHLFIWFQGDIIDLVDVWLSQHVNNHPQNHIVYKTIAFVLNHMHSGWLDVSGWHCCCGAFGDYTRNNVSKNLHFENDVRRGNRHYRACQTKENRTFTQKRTPQRTHTVRYSAKTTCACNLTSTEKIHMCAWLQLL